MKPRSLLIGILALSLSPAAFAYVDPGSGMLLWQGLIAAVGAALVFVRNPKASVKKLLDRFRKGK